MSQSGLHALTGIWFNRLIFMENREAAVHHSAVETPPGAFKYGIVLGNIAPDVDFFLLGPVYLWNSDWAITLHRSWSHSLLLQAAFVFLLFMTWTGRNPVRRRFVQGLWLGLAMHSLADLLLWFSPVELGWPLGMLGLPSVWDWWGDYVPPGWFSNFLGALDYFFAAWFFLLLARTAEHLGVDRPMIQPARRWARFMAMLFPFYLVLSWLLAAQPSLFNILHYAVYILLLLPLEIWLLYRMKETVARI